MENVPVLGHTNGARTVVEVEMEPPPQTTVLLVLSQATIIQTRFKFSRI